MRKHLVTAGLVIALVGLAHLVLPYSPLEPALLLLVRGPGPFRRTELEAVVREARRLTTEVGEEREFNLDSMSDPKSLRGLTTDEIVQPGTRAGRVWATLSPARGLVVVIETRDLSHGGEYGFAYSDTPLTARRSYGSAEWYHLDVPGLLTAVKPNMRIDDHWWRVVYNLN